MKRIGYFIIICVCLLVVAYMAPVLQERNKVTTHPQVNKALPVKSVSNKQPELKADKWAALINQTADKLPKDLGKAHDSVTYEDGASSQVYGENQTNFIEVKLTKDKKISQIFVLGRETTSETVRIGMTLSDISEKIILSDQVSFSYNKQSYQVDLTGNDLNTKPLVLFDNGSLGMIHLDQETGQTLGVSYFSAAQLLKEKPYQQLADAEDISTEKTKYGPEEADFRQRVFLRTMLVTLERQDSPIETFDRSLNKLGDELLSAFSQSPEQVIEDTNKLEQWQKKQHSQSSTAFDRLEDDELGRLFELVDMTDSRTHGIVVTPVGDINLFVMALFAGEFGQHPLDLTTDSMGYAIKNGMAVLIYQEK